MYTPISAPGLPGAPGGPSPAGTISAPQKSAQKARAALYVDGFNLYHALDEIGKNHLKWLDLWALGLALINKREDELAAVKWCTARFNEHPEKRKRHDAYKKALEANGVEALLGHFVDEEHICKACGCNYWRMSEKQGDVNVAINVIGDAHLDKFDHFLLVSADSDQVATASYFVKNFPKKKLTIVAPPGRRHSQHLLSLAVSKKTIYEDTVESCLLGKAVPIENGKSVTRPSNYDPPA